MSDRESGDDQLPGQNKYGQGASNSEGPESREDDALMDGGCGYTIQPLLGKMGTTSLSVLSQHPRHQVHKSIQDMPLQKAAIRKLVFDKSGCSKKLKPIPTSLPMPASGTVLRLQQQTQRYYAVFNVEKLKQEIIQGGAKLSEKVIKEPFE